MNYIGKYLVLLLLVTPFLYAVGYDEKGMKYYKRLCASCHGSPDYGAAQLEQAEWEDLFFMHGQKLLKAHQKEIKLYKKLRKSSRKKGFKHLETYLIDNAKDSGSVGGCDGNRCGITAGRVPMKKEDD